MFTAVLRKSAVCARLFRPFGRLAANDGGATAVEFGLVAAPFLALLIAIFQTGVVFLAGRSLDEVVAQSGRYIMTGQAQLGNMTKSAFATYVCGQATSLFTCSKFIVNVQNYSDFSSAKTSTPTISGFNSSGQALDANGKTITWAWSPGNPGDIVVVQVMYPWPLVLGPLGFTLANLSNGNRLLVSTIVFKNEPY